MLVLERKRLTYKDINNLPEGSYEVIDGEIKEMSPAGFLHGKLEGLIFSFLWKKLKDKGYMSVGEVGVLINKDPLRVRGADIVFISKEKVEKEPIGILEVPPDLIIEIVSPSNTLTEMEEKIQDYFSIGVPKVILIDPQTKKVFIHTINSKNIKVYNFNEKFEFTNGVKASINDIINQT
ncbi:MAG: Uma2 family endonuclease [Aquificae bacterium]|nr:Uma2 family endonuclease [Aquificota bacterium]